MANALWLIKPFDSVKIVQKIDLNVLIPNLQSFIGPHEPESKYQRENAAYCDT